MIIAISVERLVHHGTIQQDEQHLLLKQRLLLCLFCVEPVQSVITERIESARLVLKHLRC